MKQFWDLLRRTLETTAPKTIFTMFRNIMAFSKKSIKYHLSMKGTVMQIGKALINDRFT